MGEKIFGFQMFSNGERKGSDLKWKEASVLNREERFGFDNIF